MSAYEIQVKDVKPQPLAAVRLQTPPARLGDVIPGALDEVADHLARLGVRPAGPPVVVYLAVVSAPDGSDEELFELEIGWPVPGPVRPSERVRNSQIQGGLTAYVMHRGPYDTLSAIFPALAEWMQQHGRESAGPAREVYWSDPTEVPDPADYFTEVAWPIR